MRYAIVGNGVAGVTAAIGIRERLPDATITLYTDEPYTFYSRPGLMYHMMGTESESDLYLDRPHLYRQYRLELRHDHVQCIARDSDHLLVANQPPEPFDRLLLAVGAAPRKIGCPGEDTPGVYGFTTLSDAKGIMSASRRGMRAVVVGGGLLGAEISEVWRRHGLGVTLLVRENWYFQKGLSEEQGRLVEAGMRRHGVDVRVREEVGEFVRDGGKLTAVRTKSGQDLPCDIACVTIGVEPRKELAIASGLKVKQGIIVGPDLQTSRAGVYACGDCAEIQDPVTGQTAVELLWYSARRQGSHASRSMVDAPSAYDPGVFYNSAMFFDVYYVAVGAGRHSDDGQEELTRLCANGTQARRLVHKDGRVTGITTVGAGDRYDVLREMVERGAPVDEAASRLEGRGWHAG